jgi:FdhE protein
MKAVQRILQPGEIEALTHGQFPRVRLPEPGTLFQERAARLMQLADGNPIAGYLRFAARLAQAQHRQAARNAAPEPLPQEAIRRANASGMPLLSARDAIPAGWRDTLRALLEDLAGDGALSAPLRPVLQRLAATDDQALDTLARRALADDVDDADGAAAPIVLAALQVAFAGVAAALAARSVPFTDPATVCPVCGSAPVASVLRIGGAAGGHRYLQCAVCATEWHMVRVKCSHCESTKGVRYLGLEGATGQTGSHAVLAETCDQCHVYRKVVNQEQDPFAEPLADDLASVLLDLLMVDTAFSRASANPLLWMR